MSISIQVLSGDRYGETLNFEKTTAVGRSAQVSFDDPKLSKVHAVFELDPSLGWFVKDRGSKNGILVNTLRVESHLLVAGDIIVLGTTELRVASVSAFWKAQLNQLLLQGLDKAKNAPLALVPFRTIPTLDFIQGIQAGERYILEYGPRILGGESDDIQIFEPFCPDVAFELSPAPRGLLFTTLYPQVVRLNNAEQKKKLLKSGDQIHIHNTIIKVGFLNI